MNLRTVESRVVYSVGFVPSPVDLGPSLDTARDYFAVDRHTALPGGILGADDTYNPTPPQPLPVRKRGIDHSGQPTSQAAGANVQGEPVNNASLFDSLASLVEGLMSDTFKNASDPDTDK